MYSRTDILTFLDEPYESLSEEQRTAAAVLAQTDAEVALSLKQSRLMAQWSETALFGEPASSDAAFLVALRDRISETRTPARREVLGSARLFGLAASLCAVLMAVILGAGSRFTPSPETPTESAVLVFAAALESASPLLVDSLEDVMVDPESLAVYLDVPELAATWDFDEVSGAEKPLSDELLALAPEDMEEVLNKLETTRFF